MTEALNLAPLELGVTLVAGVISCTFPILGIEKLPAINWKILNIKKMDKNSHKKAIEKLKYALEL